MKRRLAKKIIRNLHDMRTYWRYDYSWQQRTHAWRRWMRDYGRGFPRRQGRWNPDLPDQRGRLWH